MSREVLLDLAVNRALQYLLKSGLDKAHLERHLKPWYQQTRFAYRIPLDEIIVILKTFPMDGKAYFWQRGQWHQGRNPRP